MTTKTMLVGVACLLATALAGPTPGFAAEYPERGITVVVPFPAGSTSDIIPRMLGPAVGKILGTTVVIENQAGANGSVGAARVARAAPDGYTILLGTTGVLAINQWIYAKPQYLPEKDFTPIVNLASTPNMLVVNPSVNASTLAELIELAKARPGALSFASAGYGSTSHICGEALKVAGGIDLLHVPYQGPAPAIKDVLADRVSMICDNFSNVLQYVQGGALKAIAVTARDRAKQLPDVPTSREAGYPDVEAGIWYGLVAPAGTPKDVVEKLNAAFTQALRDPAAADKLAAIGLQVIGDKPDAFSEFIQRESERMKSTVQRSGATIR